MGLTCTKFINEKENIMSSEKINKTESVSYDPHIIPSETAARARREGDSFKQTPSGDETTGGYTVDSEGLINNYAVEPEPYAAGSEKDKS